jgi:hypothetical protein
VRQNPLPLLPDSSSSEISTVLPITFAWGKELPFLDSSGFVRRCSGLLPVRSRRLFTGIKSSPTLGYFVSEKSPDLASLNEMEQSSFFIEDGVH